MKKIEPQDTKGRSTVAWYTAAMIRPFILAALGCAALSCARGPVEPTGMLKIADKTGERALTAFAAAFPRLTLSFGDGSSDAKRGADLALVVSPRASDLGPDGDPIRAGGKPKGDGNVRALRPFGNAGTKDRPAVPLAATWYALWYNAAKLKSLGLEPPEDWDSLLASAQNIRKKGITPIALGASYGRTLAYWYSYADLRLNGETAYRERLTGKRRFDDGSSAKALSLVLKMLNEGAFPVDAAIKTQDEAWRDLIEGRAVFCLSDSYALDRIPIDTDIRCVAVPGIASSKNVPRGELALVYAIAVQSDNPAASAFAGAFALAGAPGIADGKTMIPVFADRSTKRSIDQPARVDGAFILDAADGVSPPLDLSYPPQFAYDSSRLFTELARDPGSWTAGQFCARLEELRRR